MKFPSVAHITHKAGLTLKRFPLVLFAAAIAVASALYLTELSNDETGIFFNIMIVAFLGIPLFIAAGLTSEKQDWSTFSSILVRISVILLLVAYYFILPADLDAAPYKHVYRYMLYVLGVHLLVATVPYGKIGDIDAYWQYNKTMFLRFLTAVFFTVVLYAGLAIALGSVQVLLEVDVPGIRYFQLFIILAGIFNTWFFLAGIPSSIRSFSVKTDYPKGLKIFTQNILIPLVVIYLSILYVYTGKIILQWTWPEGWVANLILSFSIAGILALLLLHPIRNQADNRWIKTFSSSFFIALVPLVVLLLLAILRRIWEYSFTVERYFVLILGLWLAGIVVYFLFSKRENIKVIPGSLCILVFLVSFGPWGAFSISERSQLNRLEHYMQQNGLLQNGTIQRTSTEIPFQDRQEISNIVRYLNETHGLGGIQLWFQQDLDLLTTKTTEADSAKQVEFYDRPQHVVELMGLEYVQPGIDAPQQPSVNQFIAERDNVLEVGDVNIMVLNLNWSAQQTTQERAISSRRTLIIETDTTGIQLYLQHDTQNVISVDLNQLVRHLSNKFPSNQRMVPNEAITFDYSSGALSLKIYFKQIFWRTENDQITPENVQFDVGIK